MYVLGDRVLRSAFEAGIVELHAIDVFECAVNEHGVFNIKYKLKST